MSNPWTIRFRSEVQTECKFLPEKRNWFIRLGLAELRTQGIDRWMLNNICHCCHKSNGPSFGVVLLFTILHQRTKRHTHPSSFSSRTKKVSLSLPTSVFSISKAQGPIYIVGPLDWPRDSHCSWVKQTVLVLYSCYLSNGASCSFNRLVWEERKDRKPLVHYKSISGFSVLLSLARQFKCKDASEKNNLRKRVWQV